MVAAADTHGDAQNGNEAKGKQQAWSFMCLQSGSFMFSSERKSLKVEGG